MEARALFRLTRPHNCVFAGLGVLIGALISSQGMPPERVIFAFLATAFVSGGGNAVNDYADRELDAVNNPDRPIPSSKISPASALISGLVLFILGVVSAALIGKISCLFLAVFNSGLLAYYASVLKRKGLVGNLTIGYLVGSTLLFGGLAVGDFKTIGILAAMAGFSTAGRELIKDIEDMRGDRISGLTSFPLRYDRRKAAALAIFFTILAFAFTPIPFWLGIFGRMYLLVVIISIAVFVVGMATISKGQGREEAGKASLLYKIAMGIGLIAFFIGSLA